MPGSVTTLHLPVAEQVHVRQQPLAQQLETALVISAAPVVAVREVEAVNVPLFRIVFAGDDLGAQLVGAGDACAARLARSIKGLAVHLVGRGVVDDVAVLDAVILGTEPGVDPERLDADDLLLLVAHRARHVHHVEDHRVGHRLRLFFPRAVAHVLADRRDQRRVVVVAARGELTLQRLAVGASK